MSRLLVLMCAFRAGADVDTVPVDDHSSMLQLAHQTPSLSTGFVKTQPAQAMLQTIKGVAKALTSSDSVTMTPEAVRMAVTAAKTAASSMIPAITDEHNFTQGSVNREYHEYEACGNNVDNGILATTQMFQDFQRAKEALEQCNQELHTARQEQEQRCDAWTRLVSELGNLRPSCQHPTTEELFYENFEAWKSWIDDHDSTVQNHRTLCNDATAAFRSKEEQCESREDTRDSAFCRHRDSCAWLSDCQERQAQVYEDFVDEAQLAISSLQKQYQTIMQIECILDLIADAIQSNTTIAAGDLDACDGEADASHLSLSVQDLSPPETCPTPNQDDPVCDDLATTIEPSSDWHLIAAQDFPTLFSADASTTFLQNPNDPQSAAYMIIGSIDSGSSRYVHDGMYKFRLVYEEVQTINGRDCAPSNGNYTIIWKQSSWLTASSITGYEPVDIPEQTDGCADNDHVAARFHGLGYNADARAILDGNGGMAYWWNSVGVINPGNYNGMPSFNMNLAQKMRLYVESTE